MFITGNDEYSQGYAQIKEVFTALTKDDIFQPYISDHDFIFSNVRADDNGYNLYVFDMRYQQNFTVSQQIKKEFKLDGVVPNDISSSVVSRADGGGGGWRPYVLR